MRRHRAALAGRVAPLDDDDDAHPSGVMILNSPTPRSGQLRGMSMKNTRMKSRAQLVNCHAPNRSPTEARLWPGRPVRGGTRKLTSAAVPGRTTAPSGRALARVDPEPSSTVEKDPLQRCRSRIVSDLPAGAGRQEPRRAGGWLSRHRSVVCWRLLTLQWYSLSSPVAGGRAPINSCVSRDRRAPSLSVAHPSPYRSCSSRYPGMRHCSVWGAGLARGKGQRAG
jgi:hypothetical protein